MYLTHSNYRRNNKNKKCTGMVLNVFISKKNCYKKEKKNPGSRLGFCLQNKTANPANFHPNWSELAVLLI